MDLGLEFITAGIERSIDWLMGLQHPDGYWCGELEADSMLESDYIFMHTLLGTGDRGRMERALNEILRHQNEDGGWSLYPGGPSNVNYGVKGYLALKLMGYTADHPVMVKARENVLKLGGVVECNTFTKIYLCALGQYDYDAVPQFRRDRSLSQLVLLQYLRDQFLVPRHPGPALDHLREEALQEDSAGAGHRRALRGRP